MESQRTVEAKNAGTSLADAECVPPPAGFRASTADAVWRVQRDRFFLTEARKTSGATVGFGVIVQLMIFGILADAGYPTWRIGALAALYACFFFAHRMILGRTLDPTR